MAHYAFLDENNIVTEVITGKDETELIDGLDPETWYGNYRGQVCKRTSYNSNIRGTYAGKGFTYNEEEDIFILPQPYPSWIREGSFWNSPIEYPSDGGRYSWNEENQTWDVLNETIPE
jgi:hypothetical protein